MWSNNRIITCKTALCVEGNSPAVSLSSRGGSREVMWLCRTQETWLHSWTGLCRGQYGVTHVTAVESLFVHRRHYIHNLPSNTHTHTVHAYTQAVLWNKVNSGLSLAFYFKTPPLTALNGLSDSTPPPSWCRTVWLYVCVCLFNVRGGGREDKTRQGGFKGPKREQM